MKVVVGMSGGVDSSVAAILLKEKGMEVVGVTLRNLDDMNEAEDAIKVCGQIGIEHVLLDCRAEFNKYVKDYFTLEYLRGRTPNPCIVCNRHIKWGALMEYADSIGAEYVATGHYARIEKLESGRFSIRNSMSAVKDQTYVLYSLTQEMLARTLMPLGEYTKDEVRAIAKSHNLCIADKKDSQDICFVQSGNYAEFIREYVPSSSDMATAKVDPEASEKVDPEASEKVDPEVRAKADPEANVKVDSEAGMKTGLSGDELTELKKKAYMRGNYVDRDGNVLGEHKGYAHYTIGQSKGLNIALGSKMYVHEIRHESNEVVLCDEDVYGTELKCSNINYMALDENFTRCNATARIRYAHRGAECEMIKTGTDEITVIFNEKVRAITPGQSVVFYDGEYVLGGGIICRM